MVLKKQGTWNMCLYFHPLKNIIFKDKSPIPIIRDLLDELKGAQFFTKIYLHPGCHQIRMKEVDIPKIYFFTHEFNSEFLVIPFVLCNASSTLQSLMNQFQKPILK
jgi:hypothetical protein